jgi:hypothetical protein
MPAAIVNMSSMVLIAVIHFLCTLELTVARHSCSILEHENPERLKRRRLPKPVVPCRGLLARDCLISRFAFSRSDSRPANKER